MKSFFKFLLAAILGGIISAITFVFLFFIIITIIGAVAMGSKEEVIVDARSVLKLDLNAPIVERTNESPLSDILKSISKETSPKGLNEILASIKKAKRDSNIVGIYLRCGQIETGYATIEEIRNALASFKESGKFIVSYDEVYVQKGYYLASVADKVYLLKEGMVQLQGLAMENIYFKGLFEKLGIEFMSFRHGKYKSGIESFSADKMSDEDRLQRRELLNGIWAHIANKMAESRGITLADLNNFVNSHTIMSENSSYLQVRLVDGLVYEDEVLDELKTRTKREKSDELKPVSLKRYSMVVVPDTTIQEVTMDKIAVIFAQGAIDTGDKEGIDSKELAKTIRKAREDKNIKAIVLRVNSPGGSAMGSDVIWREAYLAKQAKPLVISMGDLAASGGYYISCVADTIFAQKATITGSVGIYAQIPNFKGAKEKLNLKVDGVSSHEKSSFLNSLSFLSTNVSSGDKAIIQAYVDRGYNTFLTRVSDGRKMSVSAVDEIAQGRVWTGLAASKNGLVDVIGGIDEAVAYAKKKAKLKNYRLVELPESLDPIQQLLKDIADEPEALSLVKMLFAKEPSSDMINTYFSRQEVLQTRLPYELTLE